jgi:1,6-anhydro-N-acetylmuramate kinase
MTARPSIKNRLITTAWRACQPTRRYSNIGCLAAARADSRSSGGGSGGRNRTLLGVLRHRLPATLSLQTSDVFGLPAQSKEAIKFGVLALAHQHKLANNIPAASCASAFAILGRAVQPPRLAVVNPELARH